MGYSSDFAGLLSKYSTEVLRQNGISKEQLCLPYFYKAMTNKHSSFADNSVDSNANVASRSSAAVMQEVDKPRQKIFALYSIWRLLHKWHIDDLDYADKVIDAILTGLIYPHDLALYVYCHYCYAYSAEETVLKTCETRKELYSSYKPVYTVRFQSSVRSYSNSRLVGCLCLLRQKRWFNERAASAGLSGVYLYIKPACEILSTIAVYQHFNVR